MIRWMFLALLAVPCAPDEWTEFQALSRDRDPDKRCQAVDRIRAHGDLRMVQALLPLLGDEHPRVRNRAAAAVRNADGAAVAPFLHAAGLRNANRWIRAKTAEALGGLARPESAGPLAAALGDADPDVRTAAVDALAAVEGARAADRLLRSATKDPAPGPRAAAVEALARVRPDALDALLDPGSKDPDPRVRVAAVLSAPRLEPGRAVALVLAAVEDPDWRVRAQAAETALELRTPELVGALIARLAREKGRLRWDIYSALRDLTRKDLGLGAGPWRDWWAAQSGTFVVPPKGGTPENAGPAAESGVQFFNLPVLSTRICFLLDLSGSMRDPAPAGGPPGTKLDVAKRETIRTIQRLPDETGINVIVLGCEGDGRYPRDQKRWKKTLQVATPATRQEAAGYVARLEAKGWTNIWDGLEAAFEDDAVDTVFVYTDGGASRGVFVATDEILAELKRMNRYRKIVVNPVEVPGDKPNTADNLRLLRGLAEATGGRAQLAK